jgi:cytidylate kinase
MSLIILEGNECCFKTTVAEKLSEQLSLPVVKGSTFEFSKCTNEELFNRFKELTELDNVIIDRFIYSNRVYATLYEDYAILSKEQREIIEQIIDNKTTVYYLYADSQIIESRIKERGDDYVVPEMVSKINNTYDETMTESNLKVVAYDTNDWSSDEIVEDIVKDYNLSFIAY